MPTTQAANGNGSGMSWPGIIAVYTLVAFMTAGAWQLFTSQIGYLKEALDIIRQEQVRRETEVKAQIAHIDTELYVRRGEFVGQAQFKEYQTSVDRRFEVMREQLHVLEQTRPTTGELAALSKSAEIQQQRLEERIRTLENRSILPVAPITPK